MFFLSVRFYQQYTLKLLFTSVSVACGGYSPWSFTAQKISTISNLHVGGVLLLGRKNEYISLRYVSAAFSTASIELILFYSLHSQSNEYPLWHYRYNKILYGWQAVNISILVVKCYVFCISKCADDVNFQSFLIVLKGNWKIQRFWYC